MSRHSFSAKSILDKISSTPSVKFVIVAEGVDEALRAVGRDADVSVIAFQDLVDAGKEAPLDVLPPKSEDLGIVNYTSGTTGSPKGVMITHANYCGIIASLQLMAKPLRMSNRDVHLCYLPLAHVLEQGNSFTMLGLGGQIGFFQGMQDSNKNRYERLTYTPQSSIVMYCKRS